MVSGHFLPGFLFLFTSTPCNLISSSLSCSFHLICCYLLGVIWLFTLSAWPYHLSRMDFTHATISSPCNIFSIFFFFFILILKRSLYFTTMYFLDSLHFSCSKHVHCFRQANLVEMYLIIFDAVVGKVGIFSLRGYEKGTGRHFIWLRLWISFAFYGSLLVVYTATSFVCFWICPLSCPQNRTQCFYSRGKGKSHLLLCTWQRGSWLKLSGDREVQLEIQFLLSSQSYIIRD